jgi:hypothetical protein
MEKHEFNIKKYPKSKHNFQCLGPCYHPDTMVVHPTQLEIVTDHIAPFCPVEEWDHGDAKTGQIMKEITDVCFNPTEKKSINNKELELNILTPYIDFNSEQFLKIYYNIFSFEDSIDWIDRNKYVSIRTRMRVINSALKTFGENIDLFDNRFTDFFIEFIKKKEIIKLYNEIHKYIGVNDDSKTINLIDQSLNSLNKNDMCVERINYTIKSFLDKDDVTKFLLRYFKHRKSLWNDILVHLDNMCIDFIDYVLNKIIITLQK